MTFVFMVKSIAVSGGVVPASRQKIREAKTPADHQAIAAFYDNKAQEDHQLHTKHLAMRDAYTAIPAPREKGKADAHCEITAKQYQEMAKEYAALAANAYKPGRSGQVKFAKTVLGVSGVRCPMNVGGDGVGADLQSLLAIVRIESGKTITARKPRSLG